jgi:predicted ATP-grasp superfamily ATP-dependent carboligase
VGLFGVDAVINSEGAWAVEVNPRYTASIEVLERSTGMAAVGWHVSACREGTLPTDVPVLASCYHGKAFVYASRRVGVTRAFRDFVERANAQALPQIADVPELGSFVDRGWPIATVFASGATHEEVRQRLQSLARETSEVLQTQE